MPESNASRPSSPSAPQRVLTLFDSTSIIVGIIIGAGIYESTPLIASNVPGVSGLVGVWLLGGLLSLVGALCYAELATSYPRAGGDFVYLTQAFGRPVGFLFAWAQLWVVRPGSIGAMAYIFGRYADDFVRSLAGAVQTLVFGRAADAPLPVAQGQTQPFTFMLYAVAAVLALSAVNVAGVQIGKWTQNVLTTAKVLGLCLVAVVGLLVGAASLFSGPPSAPPLPPSGGGSYSFGLAMIFVLFAYGGWNEMAYVGAEVRDPKKNILRALILGTVAVAAVYLVVTFGFLSALGLEGTRKSSAVAADVLRLGLGTGGGMFISLLIAVSALGAINGQVFTGARIYYAMGQQHRLYAVLGQWSPRLGTPVWSLLVQAAITLAAIIGFGWAEAGKGFSRMVIFTTPVFWFFLVLVGIGLLVLRYREPHTPRPYRVPLYPLLPLVFIASSAYMAYAGVDYALKNKSYEAFWAIGLLLLGVAMAAIEVILGFACRRPGAASEASARE